MRAMARTARAVIPGIPHHVTQRGNRRMETFSADADYREYLSGGTSEEEFETIRRHERTGRPLETRIFWIIRKLSRSYPAQAKTRP